ncbi:putative isomerase [Nymphaea thermarum]|nr:putative isomerase [Nymphaea thermarum]
MAGKGRVEYAVVDAFTESPFGGNPAAVVLWLGGADADAWMQSVAKEFNLSETAFVSPEDAPSSSGEPGRRFRLRWFTPVAEVDLCGHATLASAHFLFSSGLVSGDKIEFLTRSGLLTANKVGLGRTNNLMEGKFAVQLDFPMAALEDCDPSDFSSITAALNGATVTNIKKASTDDLLIEVASANMLQDLQPQLNVLKKFPGRGIIVTAAASPGSGVDFISRFFCPRLGIDEDPVTGSAHCALAPYWSKKLDKHDFTAYQASPRGGKLVLQLKEDLGRVLIQGEAISIMAGSILV